MIETLLLIGAVVCVAGLVGCAVTGGSAGYVGRQPFGKTADGKAVDLFTLRNAKGSEARS